eukprot:jgi/Mesen1/3285/ME001906S02384
MESLDLAVGSFFVFDFKYKSSDLANTEGASLPLAQRCKNLLVSNWRGQLNTVKAGSDKKDAASVHSSVVEYTLLDGKPLNIMLDDRGSLLAEYMRRRLRKLAEASSLAVEQAGAATRRVLAAGGPAGRGVGWWPMRGAVHCAVWDRIFPAESEHGSCNFVEAAAKHAVAVGEMAGAAPDPLETESVTEREAESEAEVVTATVAVLVCVCVLWGAAAVIQVALLEGLNRSPAHRRAFVMFCAAHMRTHAEDAFIYSADRWGFNLLANIVLEGEEGSAQWKEYRFGFQSEVRDAEGFCLVLEEMEKEIGAAVSEDKQ